MNIISTKITVLNVPQIARFVWMVLHVRNALKIQFLSLIYVFPARIQHTVVLQAAYPATKKIISSDVQNVMGFTSWIQIMECVVDAQIILLELKDAEMRLLPPNVLMTMIPS